jgi:hypothetical protein
MTPTPTPIETAVERWHLHLRGELPGGLGALLHDDVIFYSPVVFTPQRGKAVTQKYLEAASVALPGDHPKDASGTTGSPRFHYTKQLLDGDHAVLEFETTIDGKYVNGVDMITVDAAGLITEFRVMIRPLQAVNAVHQQMARQLEAMESVTAPVAPSAS